jgi:hypothetical protein
VKRISIVAALVLLVGGVAALFLAPRGRAQAPLTFETSMAKGAADSRVTIVEFSDYQ